MNDLMKRITTLTGVVIVVIALFAVWWSFFRVTPLPEGLIQANGRIEGDHYTVAGKIAGKIIELKAREGDEVKMGQVLAKLDSGQINAKVLQAKSGVVAADAECSAAEASELQSRRDKSRLQNLLKNNTASKQETERAIVAWEVDKDRLNASKARCSVAKAVLQEVKSIQDDLIIRAPAKGIITTRIVDEGEVVAAGSPLFDIVDLDRLYLKVYVPGNQIGKVRLGLVARIYIDAFPDRPFPATIRYIASRAEFTPKEVQTPDERVKLVYAVKLYLAENPDHQLTPGLPADAVIRWKEGIEWEKPRW
ncbi:MAG: secretion protein HlyD [Gammaproteobacteria bacterium]|nr:MAG: secretion protein HlyD [Gammaproteobacteria bacterium]